MRYEKDDLLSLAYYRTKEPFTGSGGGMRFRVEAVFDNEEKPKEPTRFLVTTWEEPFAFDETDDALKSTFTEEFSDDGLSRIAAKLTEICGG